ncbi:MAG: hypothetical protein AAEJ04_06570, partial [Planctomycetota bacterium]
YDAVEVWVNGVMETTLPGTATNFLVALGAGREICVRGLVANCWSELKCCDNTGTPPGIGEINCDPNQTNDEVAVSWTNPGFYSAIEVTLNGVLVQTLSATADFTIVTGVTGTREICVTGILASGAPTEPACCTVDTGGPNEPTFIRGDVNHDTSVDIADGIALLGQLFSGGNPLGCDDARDANDDGGVDIGDAISILGYLFQGGSIPAPGPLNCGPDPTVDALPLCVYTPCP